LSEPKILLITGGSRGIGAATARLAAREGYRMAINYVNDASAANKLVADIEAAGSRAISIRADVAQEPDIVRLFETVDRELGRLTHLVNNAGIVGRPSRLADADTAMIRRVIDLNVIGAILVAREATKRMSRSLGGRGGAIVNISSMAATLGAGGEYTWSAASKAAVDGFTIGLSRELAPEGVRVNAVSPGLIDTDIHASSGRPDRVAQLGPTVPMGRAGSAEEAAAAILWLLSDQASYVTGANLRVSGGR
jgi:NAD(P)-dependent dehydrogenase (short-subunit alcohol dehydrogenase family)